MFGSFSHRAELVTGRGSNVQVDESDPEPVDDRHERADPREDYLRPVDSARLHLFANAPLADVHARERDRVRRLNPRSGDTDT